jgi:ribokinase
MILVNEEGENCIVITPGANNELSPEHIQKIEEEIATAYMVVLQMEIPLATVRKVCELSSKYNTEILLNVAPAREIDTDLIKLVDILVVNETEIEKVSGKSIEKLGEEGVIDTILAQGAKTVILTLGRKGCVVKNNKINEHISAFEVDTVDTTAAGDTFCGSLVAQLSNGVELVEAIKFATAASAICVTRMGAQPSIPNEAEVSVFLTKDVALAGNGNGKSNFNKK